MRALKPASLASMASPRLSVRDCLRKTGGPLLESYFWCPQGPDLCSHLQIYTKADIKASVMANYPLAKRHPVELASHVNLLLFNKF